MYCVTLLEAPIKVWAGLVSFEGCERRVCPRPVLPPCSCHQLSYSWPGWLGARGWSFGNELISMPSHPAELVWLSHQQAGAPLTSSISLDFCPNLSLMSPFLLLIRRDLGISPRNWLPLMTRKYFIYGHSHLFKQSGFNFLVIQKGKEQPWN